MNWLLDHRGDFVVAARDVLGPNIEINWSHPRLIIIAQNYAKWDTYAVHRMGEGIELWEYVRYGDDLLYLNQVYGRQRTTPAPAPQIEINTKPDQSQTTGYTIEDHTHGKPQHIQTLFDQLRTEILALNEDEIIETPNKLYISYRHGKNFCEVQLMTKAIKIHLNIHISDLEDEQQIARDVSSIGHWGTGATEVRINANQDLDYVMHLIQQSYQLTL